MASRLFKKMVVVGLVLSVTIGALETVFRVGIFFNVSFFRDPGKYADWTSDDDYWKLRNLWDKRVTAVSSDVLDPILGWSPNRTEKNPLGVVGIHPQSIKFDVPSVLFYGDSFVQGKGPWKERITFKLQDKLGGTPVYNLGVRGYGLDQIVLKFQQSHHFFKKPVIALGLLTVDLDRSLLRFRTGQKPQFVFNQGELTLAGLPIYPNPDKWVAKNPPHIQSYLFAFLERRWELMHAPNELEVVRLQDEKRRLNEKILDLFRAEAEAEHQPAVVVLFYNQIELGYEGWREKFLKGYFDKHGVAYVDTKKLLLEELTRNQTPTESWYDSEGHLNEKGSELVAVEMARLLKERGLIPEPRPVSPPPARGERLPN
jgi:hypothetical protein